MHTAVQVDTARITDWDSFHDVCADALGFPDFYGRNLNAWIDCMTSLDEPNDGMTRVHAPEGGVLVLSLSDATDFASRCPDIFEAFVDCSAVVNQRRMEVGEPPVLALPFRRRAPDPTKQPTAARSGARGDQEGGMREQTARSTVRLIAIVTILVGAVLTAQAFVMMSLMQHTVATASPGMRVELAGPLAAAGSAAIAAYAVPIVFGVLLYLLSPAIARRVVA